MSARKVALDELFQCISEHLNEYDNKSERAVLMDAFEFCFYVYFGALQSRTLCPRICLARVVKLCNPFKRDKGVFGNITVHCMHRRCPYHTEMTSAGTHSRTVQETPQQ